MSFLVSIEPSGHTFEADPSRSILDGALLEGFLLKHSCRKGTCGSCKGQVLSGEVDHGDSHFDVLSLAEREGGLALFCCAKARSALVIDAPEVTEFRGISVQQIAGRVASIDKVSDDVAILRLMLPPEHNFRYLPGQYVQVLLKNGQRRSYSMATSVLRDNQLEWHVRYMPNGIFSGHVFNELKPRELLRLEGPFGSFFLRSSDRPMVLLASGTGFAPIQALLEQLTGNGNRRPVYLYWGGRRRSDLYRHAELLEMEQTLAWFHYTPVLSRPSPACDWLGATGFVHKQVMKDFASLRDFEVYACGAPIVVDSARTDYINERALEPNCFFADAFV